jgi:hypothetical protein
VSLVIKWVIRALYSPIKSGGGGFGFVGQKVVSRPSADSFAVGRRQKQEGGEEEEEGEAKGAGGGCFPRMT